MTDLCEQPTRAGKACRNSVSFVARPPLVRDGQTHSDLRVCGMHCNSLWLDNWQVRDVDDWTWQQRVWANRSGDPEEEEVDW